MERVMLDGRARSEGGGGNRRRPRRPTISARFRYRFDLALARGPLVVIGYLGIVTLGVIALASLVLWALQLKGVNGGAPIDDPADAWWQALVRVLDPGTFADDDTWPTRIVGLLVTLAGIFLAGSLIGLIANGVDRQIEQLRKGRSTVLEEGHTLILGWSPRLPTILSELIEANITRRRGAVVILSSLPKDEMEDELRVRVPEWGNTRIVCRTGDPSLPNDLDMVNLAGARSVVVLAGDDGDAGVVKAVLAVRSADPDFERAHVVAELTDAGHAATLRHLTQGRIVTVLADQLVAELTAQACHQAGLDAVFHELLDFEGQEIYFAPAPELHGVSYRDLLLAYEASSVFGWVRDDGRVELNPDPADRFGPGFQMVLVAQDDASIEAGAVVDAPEIEVDPAQPHEAAPKHLVVLGWSTLGPRVLTELDGFLAAGSTVVVAADPELVGLPEAIEPPIPVLTNASVRVVAASRTGEPIVDRLVDPSIDHVIVLGYRDGVSIGEADARTMLTLLTLERVVRERSVRPRVVAEVLDRTNVEVAQTTGVSDFIVSDELSSLMIAQLSERFELHQVFDELFDADGCFVVLKPASLYVPERPVAWRSAVAAAAARQETAFGWRSGTTGTVVVNPAKSAMVDLGPHDQVMVLAPRERAMSLGAGSGRQGALSR